MDPLREPQAQQLIDDFRRGFIWLHFDLFKAFGKWGYGGWACLETEKLVTVMFDRDALLDYIERNQGEVKAGTFEDFHVVLDDSHMNFIEDYVLFFKRLYLRRR